MPSSLESRPFLCSCEEIVLYPLLYHNHTSGDKISRHTGTGAMVQGAYMEEARLVISGGVQGVFYRDFVQRHAALLGVTGFVRNLVNGTVEVIAQGRRGAIEELTSRCRDGPNGADVQNVEIAWRAQSVEFKRFEIR